MNAVGPGAIVAAAVWGMLLTAGGLLYPRRPRLAGLMLVLLGLWTIPLGTYNWAGGRTGTSVWAAGWLAVCWCAVGLAWIIRFSNAKARAEHIGYWTAKAE
jgi:hypothetical protein